MQRFGSEHEYRVSPLVIIQATERKQIKLDPEYEEEQTDPCEVIAATHLCP